MRKNEKREKHTHTRIYTIQTSSTFTLRERKDQKKYIFYLNKNTLTNTQTRKSQIENKPKKERDHSGIPERTTLSRLRSHNKKLSIPSRPTFFLVAQVTEVNKLRARLD